MDRDTRSDFDRNLFEANRGLERRQVGREQPVHHGLLVLLDPSYARERELEFFVHSGAVMLKSKCFGFDTIHENNAHPSESVGVEFARRQANDVTPVEFLPLQ
jgi:hypothetical protein